MEPTLSESRELFSQESVQRAIQPTLTYRECQQFDSLFLTNYCQLYLSKITGNERMKPELRAIMHELSQGEKPFLLHPGNILAGLSSHSTVSGSAILPEIIKEISGGYYLTENGNIYYSLLESELIPSTEKISRIQEYRAIGESGQLYSYTPNIGGHPPSTIVPTNTPYPVESILITSGGYPRRDFPHYLGKDGQFGPISVPGAIKVLFAESDGLFAFLRKDKSVVFYHVNLQELQYLSTDETKNVADLSFINKHLIGLTSDGQLIHWNNGQHVQEKYHPPTKMGRIIRLGNNLVLDEYGILYSPIFGEHGIVWSILSHDLEISNIANDLRNPHAFGVAGKVLAGYVFFKTDREGVTDIRVLRTDLYGNSLIQYTEEGRVRKVWTSSPQLADVPLNANGATRIHIYSANQTDISEELQQAVIKGVLYEPGAIDPNDSEINHVYYALTPGNGRMGLVTIILARVRGDQILPID